MSWIPAAVGAVPGVIDLFTGGDDGSDAAARRRIIERYLAMRPEARATESQRASAALTTGRLKRGAAVGAATERSRVANRTRQRGLGGSPAAEAAFAKVAQMESGARERAGEAGAAQLFQAEEGNLGFERGKIMQAFGAELAGGEMDRYRNDARRATFWNSYLPVLGELGSFFSNRTTPEIALPPSIGSYGTPDAPPGDFDAEQRQAERY